MSELKPCPFCGGPAELDTRRAYCALGTGLVGDGIAVYCVGGCAADMMVCREDVPDIDAEQVVEMWNRRAAAPPPAADAVTDDEVMQALRRLWPLIERGTKGFVFTAEKAGEVAADMATLRAALAARDTK